MPCHAVFYVTRLILLDLKTKCFFCYLTGMWLTDEHIDTAQYLLSIQFIHRGISIQPCTVLEAGTGGANVGTPDGKFVQIMLVHNSHWIVVSNLECADNTVRVYDSMGPSELSKSSYYLCTWFNLLRYLISLRKKPTCSLSKSLLYLFKSETVFFCKVGLSRAFRGSRLPDNCIRHWHKLTRS